MVETMRGPIDAAKLGATLMHEHIFIINYETTENFPEQWPDEGASLQKAADLLEELRESEGISTIVDVTAVGLGRNTARLERLAQLTDINIITCTGLYVFALEPHVFRYRGPGKLFDEPDPIYDLLLRDITEGVAGTSVKAGILKCASDSFGLTPGVERILRVTAQVHRATGVPISTHTLAAAKSGLEQQRVFEEEGVDLSRVIIGHCGDTTDLDYLEELIQRGSYLGMDRFGLDAFLPFKDRVETVAELCKRGHANRLVVGHDASAHDDGHNQQMLKTLLPNWHWRHFTRDVVPALRERGVEESEIEQILVGNPRAIFARTGAY